MEDIPTIARDSALHCEAKKHAYRQTQDGVVVSFVLHPQEVPDGLATAPLGTRYVLAMVEINDDETPKEVMPAEQSTRKPETPPRPAQSSGGAKSWHEMAPAQQAGILCNEVSFRRFLAYRLEYKEVAVLDLDMAADAVRQNCGVSSRGDIKPGTKAADRWSGIVSDYRAWMREPETVF